MQLNPFSPSTIRLALGGKVSFCVSPRLESWAYTAATAHQKTPYIWTWPNQLQKIFSQSFVKSTVTSRHWRLHTFPRELNYVSCINYTMGNYVVSLLWPTKQDKLSCAIFIQIKLKFNQFVLGQFRLVPQFFVFNMFDGFWVIMLTDTHTHTHTHTHIYTHIHTYTHC
jgi:hypothetical protein